MAVDETLLEAAASDGQCTVRFYRWQQPTLSLGYFQGYGDRWQHESSSRAAAVRRQSGGGAILHDRELTYSFAVPGGHPLAVGRLGFYRIVHSTLIEALAQWGIEATMYGTSSQVLKHSPSPPPPLPLAGEGRNRQPFLCFQRRSPGDVLVGETKIAGSAQRRCRGAVLQHGSVLLAQSPAAPELSGIKELADKTIMADELVKTWLPRLMGALGDNWQKKRLSEAQSRRAELLAQEKYASPLWTERRGRR